MQLEDKELVQIDATVITGLLIFLTIGFVETSLVASLAQVKPVFSDIGTRIMIIISMLTPFVISATTLLTLNGEQKRATRVLKRFARKCTAIGFVWLLGNLVALFAVVEISNNRVLRNTILLPDFIVIPTPKP